ncbi:IclR family transcriptional regulator [Cupriavidus taiwanensis]|uniref:Putative TRANSCRIPTIONal REGULATOR, IclR family n=1 Tax=Cupriavidus taiwanensis TaxID=164546 RepID=A0A375FRE9_9BURK|nr:IclR family transcriptional regulator [Cupriavidus taiwanensis]SOY43754.1 putative TRANSCRIPTIONal REGULATOR, IclR family [Cupriavidus taiwanensis]SOY85237.1 putative TRANSCRIPTIONal REGULATOR, IclR family [Cupriavidus taiwanensis]SOY99860.1 putative TRANSCRIPTIONal REGULATOR, IclR family [Cupriavidus taiwanensis]SOZ02894.1 putative TRANSCRIPTIONal REGULATOR, IclR family [Cupriavidus taiwanensis]SPC06298.1 putative TRANSCRIPTIONal REGULATOR, IclR family [Cupriavidus taiwanensis]
MSEIEEEDAKLRSGIQSIEVGFRLLQALAASPRAMMLRDLAAAADMNPAKAHRYLVSFMRLGAVAQDPVSGRYDLGPFALQLGLAGLNRLDPVKKARPILSQLRDELDLTAGIAVWGNHGPTVVHWEESSHPVTVSLRLGDVMPMLNSATGRLYGAYLPRKQTLPLIERELGARGHDGMPDMPRTLADYDAICAEVRKHGAARTLGGVLPGINAFSMPVFDANGHLAMGLIVLGAQSIFDAEWGGTMDRRVRAIAQQLSSELGYLGAATLAGQTGPA